MIQIALPNLVIDRMTLLKLSRLFADEEGTCLFYSGSQYETASRSFLCLFPYDFIKIHGRQQKRYLIGEEMRFSLEMSNPWEALKVMLPEMGRGESSFPEWVGFFGYEMGAFNEKKHISPYTSGPTPEAYWQKCAIVLSVDHSTNTGKVAVAEQAEYFFDDEYRHWIERLSSVKGWEDLIEHSKTTELYDDKQKESFVLKGRSETISSYVDKINKIKELIRSGDIYQINLSQQFDFLGTANAFNLFTRLALLNPAPFAAYLHLGNFSLISSSPERFLSKTGDMLETRPIKGTAPRGCTPEEDKANREALLNSPKEKAELLMITDLMRNDLGKISQVGSVNTPLVWGCESYANVFHLHSIVRSKLQSHVHPLDAVKACFPGGSITGCPKHSAMQIIADIEGRSRGIYTGAIGYFAANGDFDLNIAIRTFVKTKECLSLQLGGGIVIDSDPHKEYEETLQKGQSIFKILGFAI